MQWKTLGFVMAMVIASVASYQYAAALYSEDIASLREEYASRARALERTYREKEKQYAQNLVAAWNERDAALARVSDLGGDLSRVRDEAAAYKRRLSATAGDSCSAYRKRLAESAGLLEEGAGLLAEGAGLAERTAIDKDALANIAAGR